MRPTFYRKFVKRPLDVLVASTCLVMLSPLILITAVAVRMLLGSPVLFRQWRPGRHGELFCMLKFRTMQNWSDASGCLLPDGQRLTRFGRFLRATSVDELPELWNVLRGEMSLVGPRPLLAEYLPLYNHHQARRHEVQPGLTGLAQIRGRNLLSWEERFEADICYVDHMSFWLDAKILLVTPLRVLSRRGISAAGHVTMPKFTGESSHRAA